MKQLILPLSLLLLTACGNQESKTEKNTATEQKAEPAAGNPRIQQGEQLVASNDCFGCHQVGETMTGPSYFNVADRYRDSVSPALIDTLAARIIRGSSGHWGPAQMTPHPSLSTENAKLMVEYILSLKP